MALALALVCAAGAASAAPIAQAATLDPGDEIALAVDEAALRFGLPHAWILAVIRVESAGRPRAISSKGAMGLLQLMPATWRELSAQMALGDDPYDVRANVLAGAAYLRRMYDRFGSPGFLAAYNAGPERYAQHLAVGRPLPRETQDYVRALVPAIGATTAAARGDPRQAAAASGLFVEPSWRDGAVSDRAFPSVRAKGLWP
ncbi:transglycosylase [Caulobacter flavus]|uniref:Transglycosylase n=2 Tax=Caulobacter flavus TaxID=1679497 RepID=A0A2N5CPJ2_9CAUL|nr:transglycosylase [Caulobacter flavus]PLR08872.1 transglycosylase [Caulobacter flavus]